MSDETWSQDEWAAFYEMADAFLVQANALIASELIDQVAAAMLYACSRFNTFAMQVQADDRPGLDDEAIVFLTEELESHLRDQMEEPASPAQVEIDKPVGGPDSVILILRGMDGRLEEEVSDFLDLADRFVAVANVMVGQVRVARVSAAFMYAATRFNVYTMRCHGLPTEKVDETLVTEFCRLYAALVHYHGQDSLVAEDD